MMQKNNEGSLTNDSFKSRKLALHFFGLSARDPSLPELPIFPLFLFVLFSQTSAKFRLVCLQLVKVGIDTGLQPFSAFSLFFFCLTPRKLWHDFLLSCYFASVSRMIFKLTSSKLVMLFACLAISAAIERSKSDWLISAGRTSAAFFANTMMAVNVDAMI